MNQKIIIGAVAFFILWASGACSEDKLTPIEDMGKPQYVLPQGEPGSLDSLIYDFYERYGTYVLYDFQENDIRNTWTYFWSNYYVPVKSTNREYAKKMLIFLKENVLDNYMDDFVRKNLVYQIFLVDSVFSNSAGTGTPGTVLTKEKAFVVGNVAPRLDSYTAAQWATVKNDFVNAFTQGFYDAAEIKPSAFLSLRPSGIVVTLAYDPLNEYERYQYTFYMAGFIKWRNLAHGNSNSMYPVEAQDFADYITFLTTNTRSELQHALTRFELVRKRAMLLVPYLKNVLDLDVITTQNNNCPEDPIPANFFEQF